MVSDTMYKARFNIEDFAKGREATIKILGKLI